MRAIPINVQTLYADLSQKVRQSATVPASISRKIVGGATYLYAVERHGAARVQRYLGPEHDENARAAAEAARREADLARGRRKTITMLKAAGVDGPRPEVGRLLEAISRAGLFSRGLVLVGTVAYQLYPMMLGMELDEAAMATEDADFFAANVRLAADEAVLASDGEQPEDEGKSAGGLLAVLRRADSTFAAAPTLRKSALPSRFTSGTGLDVELLTPVRRREEEEPVHLPYLGAGAIPLHFLEYLVESALPAVVLHGSGVAVTVPQPARYAVHKLIVAQRRMTDSPKRGKDLAQARALFDGLNATNPDALDDALADARERGRSWDRLIEASLRQIGQT